MFIFFTSFWLVVVFLAAFMVKGYKKCFKLVDESKKFKIKSRRKCDIFPLLPYNNLNVLIIFSSEMCKND